MNMFHPGKSALAIPCQEAHERKMKKQMEETLEATREARTMQVGLATGYDLIPQSISSYQKK